MRSLMALLVLSILSSEALAGECDKSLSRSIYKNVSNVQISDTRTGNKLSFAELNLSGVVVSIRLLNGALDTIYLANNFLRDRNEWVEMTLARWRSSLNSITPSDVARMPLSQREVAALLGNFVGEDQLRRLLNDQFAERETLSVREGLYVPKRFEALNNELSFGIDEQGHLTSADFGSLPRGAYVWEVALETDNQVEERIFTLLVF